MKNIIQAILCLCILVSLCGCSTQKLSTEKIRDIEFTVVDEDEIPEELQTMIKEKETKPFKLTYQDQGMLYITEGYGEQDTNGYSVQVTDCYETENAIYFHTNLIGPSKEERIVNTKTYPNIVIKMEIVDKNVVFQ